MASRGGMSPDALFSYHSARSRSFLVAIAAVIAIEATAFHLLLMSRHSVVALCLDALSLLAVAWLVSDYIALGRGAVRIEDGTLHLAIGRRFDITVPLSNVARALQPTFRDLPTPGTTQGRDYLNLTRPASPNVLIVLQSGTTVRLPGGLHRLVTRFGLHLDEPAAFLAELGSRAGR